MFLTLVWNFTHLGHWILEGKENTNTEKMIWIFSRYTLAFSLPVLVLFSLLTWSCKKYTSNNNIRIRKIYIYENEKHVAYFDTGRSYVCMQEKWAKVRQQAKMWKCSCNIFIGILRLLLLLRFFNAQEKSHIQTLCCIPTKTNHIMWVRWILCFMLNFWYMQRHSCHIYSSQLYQVNVFDFVLIMLIK